MISKKVVVTEATGEQVMCLWDKPDSLSWGPGTYVKAGQEQQWASLSDPRSCTMTEAEIGKIPRSSQATLASTAVKDKESVSSKGEGDPTTPKIVLNFHMHAVACV